MHAHRLSILFVLYALIEASLLSVPVDAGGPPPARTPRDMVAEYFADLNAHRFRAAWLLEAPCGVSYPVPNGPGAPVGSTSYPGKGTWSAPQGKYAQHPILASAAVTRISRLHIAILDRNHILAFGVAGWFKLDYSLYASDPSFNNRHKSGFHVIRIGLWKCNGQWGIEPSYWLVAGGGELNWV